MTRILKYIAAIILIFSIVAFSFHQKKKTFRSGKDYALFFAVNNYDNMRNLQNPIRNARSLANELEENYGFQTEVITNPTLDDIERKLDEYQTRFAQNRNGQYQSNGQLLVFFSGHGIEEDRNGYFLPKDVDPKRLYRTSIAYNIWREKINKIDCKHILVAIDACFSVTFDPGWWNRSGPNVGKRPGELSEGQKLLANHESNKARLFFTSDAKKDETPDHSTFAKKFLEGLKSGGGSDGILTSSELFTYLEFASPNPHRGEFGDDEAGSSFLFILENPLRTKAIDMSGTDQLQRDLQAWRSAKTAHSITTYQEYLRQFRNGEFRPLAIAAISELEAEQLQRREDIAWEVAKEKNTKEAYQKFLDTFSNSRYYNDATSQIKKLKPASTTNANSGTFTDSRDGQNYKWVRLKDGKKWMTENLNYKTADSWWYDNKSSNGDKYGRLYIWQAAKKACPSGWRLPSDDEWWKMASYYGKAYNRYSGQQINKEGDAGEAAYKALVQGGNSGFSALLSGHRYSSGSFYGLDSNGYYWSSSEKSSHDARSYGFRSDIKLLPRSFHTKSLGFYCRCLQD